MTSIGVMQNQQQGMPQLFEEGEDDDDGDGRRKRAPTKLRNTFKSLIAVSSAKHNFTSFEGCSDPTQPRRCDEIFAFISGADGSVVFESFALKKSLEQKCVLIECFGSDDEDSGVETDSDSRIGEVPPKILEEEKASVPATIFNCVNNLTNALQVVAPGMLFVSGALDAARLGVAFKQDLRDEESPMPFNAIRIGFDAISSCVGCFFGVMSVGGVGFLVGGSIGVLIAGPMGAVAGASLGTLVGKISGGVLGCFVGSCVGKRVLNFTRIHLDRTKRFHHEKCWEATEELLVIVDDETSESYVETASIRSGDSGFAEEASQRSTANFHEFCDRAEDMVLTVGEFMHNVTSSMTVSIAAVLLAIRTRARTMCQKLIVVKVKWIKRKMKKE